MNDIEVFVCENFDRKHKAVLPSGIRASNFNHFQFGNTTISLTDELQLIKGRRLSKEKQTHQQQRLAKVVEQKTENFFQLEFN